LLHLLFYKGESGVKNTATTIDRGTLLLSGGTAALATLLLGATKTPPKKGFCCDPIDLSYETTTGPAALKKLKSAKGAPTVLKGVKLVAAHMGDPSQPVLAGWTGIGLIPSAKVAGDDQNGKGVDQPLGYGVWVYTK
jgi:hypothetical protein